MKREASVQLNDLMFVHPYTAGLQCWAKSRTDIAVAIQAAAKGQSKVRAIGSNYSLSDVGVAQNGVIIRTDDLDRVLGLSTDRAFTGDLAYRLPRHANRHFAFLEAGIKIKDLLHKLAKSNLTLPTMGSGGGQSLIGALATGSHGGDLKEPVLAERIHGIYLFDAKGMPHWISRAQKSGSTPFLCPERKTTKKDEWADEIEVTQHLDTELFNACMISLGRFGVIYAVLIEVVPQYFLIESNERKSIAFPNNVLATVINDVFWGTSITDAGDIYLSGNPERKYRGLVRSKLPMDFLPAFEASGMVNLHHANVVFNLASRHYWLRQRWKFDAPQGWTPDVPTPSPPSDDLISRYKSDFSGLVDKVMPGPLQGHSAEYALSKVTDLAGEIAKALHLGGKYKEFLDQDIAAAALHALHEVKEDGVRRRIGDGAVAVVQKMFKTGIKGKRWKDNPEIFARLTDMLFEEMEFSEPVRAGTANQMMDTHNYAYDGMVRAFSAEFFFDANKKNFSDFIASLLIEAESYYPVIGYVGMRYMPQATGLLAMQRFPQTISVEVTVFPGADDAAPGLVGASSSETTPTDPSHRFFKRALDIARAISKMSDEAIPHWGQQFTHNRADLERLYGQDLTKWRDNLKKVDADSTVFATQFTSALGLEP